MRGFKTIISMFIMAFFMSASLIAQDKRYVVVKGGFGLPFGAYGLNIEYRWFNLGGYFGAGYMKAQNYREINIKSTINSALGLKYYFFKPEDGWRPIIGIHAGWLNNYYLNKIGTMQYNPTVYGLAGIVGFELSEKIVSLEMSLVFDPGFAILKPETHPYYKGKIYVTPTIGVGVNLYALKRFLKGEDKSKTIKNVESTEYVNSNLVVKKQAEENPVTKLLATKIVSDCNDTLGFKAVKSLIRDKYGRLLAGKQIAEDLYLFVRFQQNGAITGQSLQITYIDSTNKSMEVQIVKTNKPEANIESLSRSLAAYEDVAGSNYKVIQGKATIFYYGNERNEMSIRLTDLIMSQQNKNQLYYDEILICILAEKK